MKKNQLTELTLTDKERACCESCFYLIEQLKDELNTHECLEGQNELITKTQLDVVSYVLGELRDTWNLYVIPEREE